ncbi:hypothetical protein AC1031_004167, partial [Aphanomyces cochlioides]
NFERRRMQNPNDGVGPSDFTEEMGDRYESMDDYSSDDSDEDVDIVAAHKTIVDSNSSAIAHSEFDELYAGDNSSHTASSDAVNLFSSTIVDAFRVDKDAGGTLGTTQHNQTNRSSFSGPKFSKSKKVAKKMYFDI